MLVSDFHFDLPEELIAQHPPAERGASRMLVVDRASGELTDAMFRDLPEYLRAGDLLVLNDSRVLPARLFGVRAGTGTQTGLPRPSGVVEVLLVEEVDPTPEKRDVGHPHTIQWRALVKPAKKVRVGERLEFRESRGEPNAGILRSAQNDKLNHSEAVLTAEVVEAGDFGERVLRFGAVEDFYGVVGRIGHMPLPPYIRRARPEAGAEAPISLGNPTRGLKPAATPGEGLKPAATPGEGLKPAAGRGSVAEDIEAEDRERYQTVYARAVGSAAAPTAGLHFTPEVLAALQARGVEIAYVTLHVGLGTFQPVRVDRLEDIRLHAERYTLPSATADALNRAVVEGRRVVAVGTTTTRTLEHIAAEAEKANHRERRETERAQRPGAVPGKFEAHSGSTSMFIGPGHRFRVVGGLLTNFHLPESTLLMLVSAFAGREAVLAAYGHGVREGYRFYSYGDCMLVV